MKGVSLEEWHSISTDNKYYVTDDQQDLVSLENEFKCPECNTYMTGYPDECEECEVNYNW